MATIKSSTKPARRGDFTSALPSTLYWDASFAVNAIYERGTWHADCSAFMTRLENSETISFVSTLALDEIWFSLLQLLISDDYRVPFWRVVNDDPTVVTNYIDRLETITNEIYANPKIRVVSISSRGPRRALKNMREFHLLPRDAMHLAAMRQHKIEHIVTTDADFVSVSGISIFT
ncbi:MAG: type II toxin-antitoxin system VapC family toxin, partial [Chloroflexota bacterium]|nr:type II toxin-antitoxin system VapC family toxin [Chloroflexota bacterium]